MQLISRWASIAGLLIAATSHAAPATLVVHEWGTFTSFQDANGATIPGINVDDEPVPEFVHRLQDLPIFTARSRPARWSQGAPRCHPDVTLRLETPVVYFYPRESFTESQRIIVRAAFEGGWLTEFYPFAAAENDDFPTTLTRATRGTIEWNDLRLPRTPSIDIPQSSERVWLAPRATAAAVVESAQHEEAEKYLFYRGVGHVDAPVIVRERANGLTVAVRTSDNTLDALPQMWLVRVLPDGRVWYRSLAPKQARSLDVETPDTIEQLASHESANELRRELGAALAAQHLFEDEAIAMIETWRVSYFESEGLRLFFLLPQPWTDAQLPLSVTPAADITRVMLGRIELVSPHQRSVLQRLYRLPVNSFPTTVPYVEQAAMPLLNDPTKTHADFYRALGRGIPEPLRLYDSLGRFRDALLAHELRRATDVAKRTRLRRIIETFSACVPEGRE